MNDLDNHNIVCKIVCSHSSQEQHFEATAKEQAENRHAPDAAATKCSSSWSSSICGCSSQPVCDAHKMSSMGNPEAFVEPFEHVAAA